MATVDILPNNEVNVTVPHCDGAGTAQTSVFRGPKKSHTKECVLIIDHNTGEITLERLSHNIQLKKTRYYFIFIRKHAVFPCKAVLLIKPHLSFFFRAEGTTKAGQSLSPADTIQMPHSYQSRKLSPNHSHKSPSASVSPTLSPPYRYFFNQTHI